MVRVLTAFACLYGTVAVSSFGNMEHQHQFTATKKTEKKLHAKLQKLVARNVEEPAPEAALPGIEELDEILGNMNNVNTYVVDEIGILSTRVTNANAAIAACNTERAEWSSTTGATQWQSCQNKHTAHSTCRNTQATMYSDRGDKLLLQNNYASTAFDANPAITNEGCGCDAGDIGDAATCGSCTVAAKSWHDLHRDELNTRIGTYNDIYTQWGAKITECKGLQEAYETAMCDHSTAHETSCEEFNTCYTEKTAARAAITATIDGKNREWNDLCFSSEKVKCFVGLLKTAHSRDLVASDVNGCVHPDPPIEDCATYTAPVAAAQDACVTPATSYPGDATFGTDYYAGMHQDSPVNATQSC